MRTTVEIPDGLYQPAAAGADLERIPRIEKGKQEMLPMIHLKPSRRWKSLSLLTVIPLLLLTGISVAWIVLRQDRVQTVAEDVSIAEEEEAVKAVLALGGKVMYEQEYCKNIPTRQGRVWCVDLTDTKATDASLDCLAKMPELRDLRLDGTSITDAGLERLTGAKRLGLLYLARTRITDDGLDTLAGLPQLFFVHIGDTRITNQGVDKLRRLLPKCYVAPFDVSGPPQ